MYVYNLTFGKEKYKFAYKLILKFVLQWEGSPSLVRVTESMIGEATREIQEELANYKQTAEQQATTIQQLQDQLVNAHKHDKGTHNKPLGHLYCTVMQNWR